MDATKEVYFHEYCKTCKYKDKEDWDDPCNDCLAQGYNYDSHKPVEYQKGESNAVSKRNNS